jgi:4-hydroxy-tetrahydrodipicolinate synthase
MNQLKGTGVAVVTPFKQNKDIDFKALEKTLDHVINGGIDYIVSLGTTGETPVLSTEERNEIVGFTMNYVAGRIPVVVGIGGNDTSHILHEFEKFPLNQAVAILSASPYYNKPSQEGLFQHYKTIAAHSPKPLILYNVPGRTGRNLEAKTTLRIAREVENVIGIKEASGSMEQCMEILKERPDNFLVMSGDDDLALPQMACGMDGVISVAANAFPAAFSRMVKCCSMDNYQEARKINRKLMRAYKLMFAENNPAGVKAFLSEMGLIENYLRLPLVPLSEGLQLEVRDFLKNMES